MNKTIPTLRFLSKGFTWLTTIGFLSILGSTAIGSLIQTLLRRSNPGQPVGPTTATFEVTAAIFAVLIGMLLFLITLKMAVANGISRKTFLLANLPAALAAAAAFSMFNYVLYLILRAFRPVTLISQELYPQINGVGVIMLQIATYFLLIAAGWFITLAYSRSSTLVRWLISLTPFVLYAILRSADAGSGGAVGAAIEAFQRASMGTPLRAIITLVIYSAILVGLVYLLIRRAPVKN